jgi:hypothetical protein
VIEGREEVREFADLQPCPARAGARERECVEVGHSRRVMMNTLGANAVTEHPMDDVERVTLEPRVIVGLRQRVTVDELSGFFAHAIPAVAGELARVGTPRSVRRSRCTATNRPVTSM